MQPINGDKICRKLASSAVAIILALAMLPAPAIAAVDDLQIDWIVPAGTFADAKTVERGNVVFNVKPLPRKLYATTRDVTATGGQKLLPAGAQLYAMIGIHLLACSQAQGPEGYASHSSRICLLDSDGDGRFDSYFERNTGKAFLTSDGMWYAMNGNPGAALPLTDADFVEVSRTLATERPEVHLKVDFFYSKRRGMGAARIEISIDKGPGKFLGNCTPKDVMVENGRAKIVCLTPDLIFGITVPQGEHSKTDYEVVDPRRDVAVRFDVAPRLMGGRLMDAIHFF